VCALSVYSGERLGGRRIEQPRAYTRSITFRLQTYLFGCLLSKVLLRDLRVGGRGPREPPAVVRAQHGRRGEPSLASSQQRAPPSSLFLPPFLPAPPLRKHTHGLSPHLLSETHTRPLPSSTQKHTHSLSPHLHSETQALAGMALSRCE
jgi:hypothetical protein